MALAETYDVYLPSKMRLGREHPVSVLETAAMTSVEPCDVYYRLDIPITTIQTGQLSCLQLETIAHASQIHEHLLPDGSRTGFLISDGAGVGKTRTLLGLVYENSMKGRQKAIWITVSTDLRRNVIRDLADIGATQIYVRELDKFKFGSNLSSQVGHENGIMFSTYSELIKESHDKTLWYYSRMRQLLQWCGEDFHGLIIIDECHKATNVYAADTGEVTQIGKTVNRLQRQLPNARVVYASAAGVSEPKITACMLRLGLWGQNTAFGSFNDFIAAMETRAIGAMEVLGMDLKLRGMYIARHLSFEDVRYKIEEVYVSRRFREIYDQSVELWVEAKKMFTEAAELINFDSDAKEIMWREFWLSHQIFFKYLSVAPKVTRAILCAREAIKRGKSVVISLQSSGEPRTSDQLEKYGGEIADFASTTKEIFQCLVERHFPVPNRQEFNRLLDIYNKLPPPPEASSSSKVNNSSAASKRKCEESNNDDQAKKIKTSSSSNSSSIISSSASEEEFADNEDSESDDSDDDDEDKDSDEETSDSTDKSTDQDSEDTDSDTEDTKDTDEDEDGDDDIAADDAADHADEAAYHADEAAYHADEAAYHADEAADHANDEVDTHDARAEIEASHSIEIRPSAYPLIHVVNVENKTAEAAAPSSSPNTSNITSATTTTDAISPAEAATLNAQRTLRLMLDKRIDAMKRARALKGELLLKIERLGTRLPSNSIDQLIEDLGGPHKVAEISGRRRRPVQSRDGSIQYETHYGMFGSVDWVNTVARDSFMWLRKKVAIVIEPASGGISLHSDRRWFNKLPRVHITIELPWCVDQAIQQLGRTHRANEVNSPEYIFLITDQASERRLAFMVAKRLESLGALTKHDRRATGTRDLAQFNVNNKYGQQALRTMLHSIIGQETPLVPPPTGYIGDYLVNFAQGLIGVGLIVNSNSSEQLGLVRDYDNMSIFLKRIRGCPMDLQNHLFKYFTETMAAIIQQTKIGSRPDLHALELGTQNEQVHRVRLTRFLRRFNIGLAPTDLHIVREDRGLSWHDAVYKFSELCHEDEGFYLSDRLRNNRRTVIMVIIVRSTYSSSGSSSSSSSSEDSDSPREKRARNKKEIMCQVYRPNTGLQAREESLFDLEQKYRKVRMVDAEPHWTEQFDASEDICAHMYWHGSCRVLSQGSDCEVGLRQRFYHVLTGSLFTVWSRVENILNAHGTSNMQAIRIKTDGDEIIVGILIPRSCVMPVMENLNRDSEGQSVLFF